MINYILLAVVVLLVIVLIVQRKQLTWLDRHVFSPSIRKVEVESSILKLLQERGELSNAEIRSALNLSERSVVRYMDDLQKSDKVEQVGTTGKWVVYRVK